jgi:hypothetical protein
MRGIADIDLVWIAAREERVLFGVDGFAEVSSTRSGGTSARRVDAVSLLPSDTVVSRTDDPVVLVYQNTTNA